MSKLKEPFLWPLLLLIAANALIFADATALRFGAALVLLAFLPGWIWLRSFIDLSFDRSERAVIAIGLSLALSIIGAMVAVYLPGPLKLGQLLVTVDIFIIAGLVVNWWQVRFNVVLPSPQSTGFSTSSIALLLILLLAAMLRLPHLGYAEFHEDEAEALMLGVRLLQGEDYALFLHRKGPAQMLLPVAFWLVTGRISEELARFPFALSSLLSAAVLYFIGRRWFGWSAGLIAGLLWAINGYAIAFGRMVQYQALLFFWGPLTVYCLYLAWKEHRPRLLFLAAILLGTSLLAHFDALMLLPAAAYLALKLLKHEQDPLTVRSLRARLATVVLALILFIVLLASFYIPYLLDPEFQNTANYLAGSRVKPGLLYNNLSLLRRLDADYSSHFYLPILALGLVGFVVWQSRNYSPTWRRGLVGLGLLVASTVWLPQMWQVGAYSLAVLPWAVALGALWFWGDTEIKAAWLMAGAPIVGYVFLVDDPRTHLYILYPGAIVLAGAGWVRISESANGRLSEWLNNRIDRHLLTVPIILLLLIGLLLSGLIFIYAGSIFLSRESELTQLRRQWEDSTWEAIYGDLPQARSYFGYPKREGWKTIGSLRTEGLFPGDFRSINEDFVIPIWYNYGEPRSCYDTPAHFFVRTAGEEMLVPDRSYSEVGRVQREGETRLQIFSARAPSSPTVYALEDYEGSFDRWATPEQFTQQAKPRIQLETQFGRAIRFVGYDLSSSTVAPGETLQVNLYWQAIAPPDDHYRAFVHLTDGSTLWAQQDEEPACRLPTTIWRAGQRAMGQFRLPVSEETPPGRYPLVMGLYQADTLERLQISAGAGQLGDNFLWLGDVEVIESD